MALTNHLVKIFERVVRMDIVRHLEENMLMNPSQHGFKTGHSTMTDLLAYMDSVLSILEAGEEVDVVYLDLAKAFDKVDHNVLLHKMFHLGIRGKVLSWLREFLKNRKQAVRVGGHLSELQWVVSGVPQGSVLGPLLFIIMMLDVDRGVSSGLISYADDTKLWKAMSKHLELQGNLNSVYGWIGVNNMSLNGPKFLHLHIGRAQEDELFLSNENEIIQTAKTAKDLGVTFSADLKFETHILNMVRKASILSGWILRTFRTRATGTMLILLKCVLRPALEYACVVWSPNQVRLISLIESVQRTFTKRFSQLCEWDEDLGMNVCKMDYWERMKILKISSLERRRERYMILFLYKILVKEYPDPGFDIQLDLEDRDGVSIESKIDLSAEPWVRTVRGASFFNKAPQLFRMLPREIRQRKFFDNPSAKLKADFKIAVDRYLSTVPDQPTTNTCTSAHRAAHTNSILYQDNYRTPYDGSFVPTDTEETED